MMIKYVSRAKSGIMGIAAISMGGCVWIAKCLLAKKLLQTYANYNVSLLYKLLAVENIKAHNITMKCFFLCLYEVKTCSEILNYDEAKIDVTLC